MEERTNVSVGFLRMAILAALSAVALVGVSAWQAHRIVVEGNPVYAKNSGLPLPGRASTPYGSVDWQASLTGETDDPDGLGNIADNVGNALLDSYTTLSGSGLYTLEEGIRVAEDIASSLRANVSHKTYVASDVKTDPDTSYKRMLAYRSDLRIALEPLLENPGYELGLFANYVESGDATHLERLATTAANYEAAIANAREVVVPEDALSSHLGILNALSAFSTTIARLGEHADDAFASAALLRTYNESEADLMTSFNALAVYYKSKLP